MSIEANGTRERLRMAEARLDTAEKERRELWRSQGNQDERLGRQDERIEGLVDDVKEVRRLMELNEERRTSVSASWKIGLTVAGLGLAGSFIASVIAALSSGSG